MNVKGSYRIFLTVCMFVSAHLENENAKHGEKVCIHN
jgi:hypothetical protein